MVNNPIGNHLMRILPKYLRPFAWHAVGGSIWNHKTSKDDEALYDMAAIDAAVSAAINDVCQCQGAIDDASVPQPGSRWLHKSGTTYTVAMTTNLSTTRPDEYPPTVVYFSETDVWWSRPLLKWHGSMTLLPLGVW